MNLLNRTILRICEVLGTTSVVQLQGSSEIPLDFAGKRHRHEWTEFALFVAGGGKVYLEFCSCGELRFAGLEREPVPDLFLNHDFSERSSICEHHWKSFLLPVCDEGEDRMLPIVRCTHCGSFASSVSLGGER